MIFESLRAWAERTPGAPALIGRGYTVSYGALLRGAYAGAAWLYGCGVRTGETVALSLEPDPALIERQVSLLYAAAYLGAALLPIYPVVPPALRGPLAARFSARWLIGSDASEAMAGCIKLDLMSFHPESDEWVASRPARSDDPACPLRYEFTSGTTGSSKAVLFTGAQIAMIMRVNAQCLRWTPEDRLLPAVRWPGKAGMRTLMRIHAAGGALVNEPFPKTRGQLADFIEEFGLTSVNSVPWQLRQLLASEPPAGRRTPPLRYLGTAGAFIPPQDIRAVRAALTPNMHVIYASSETAIVAHLGPEDPFDAGLKLVTGAEGQAVDDDDHPLPAGASGRLRFRAPWIPSGYVGDEPETARFVAGWFYTGDCGAIDSAGRIVLEGRSDDKITYGGTKITPQDVEAVLRQHPDVADAVLIGLADPLKGQIPVAFVVLRRDVSGRTLLAFYSAWLDQSCLPAAVVAVQQIPRNHEGKVQPDRLREIFLESARRR